MIKFKNTTQSSLISSIVRSHLENSTYEPYGVSWGDLNNDDYPDVYINHHNKTSAQVLVNQKDETFADAELSFPEGDDHGAGWFDFDNDGDDDLFQSVGLLTSGPASPNRFYINEEGTLVEQASLAGLEYTEGRGRTPVVFDYDRDGLLDIFFSAIFAEDKGILPSTVFHQLPDRTFEDVGAELGFSDSLNNPFGIISDFSGNGVLDLFLFPREGVRPDIYETTSIPFTEISSELLPTVPPLSYRPNAASGDLNGDLIPDLVLSNVGGFFQRQTVLLLSSENGWVDASTTSGIGTMLEGLDTGYGGLNLGDFDNDGDLDIYFATNISEGLIDNTITNPNVPNIIAENQGDGTFVQVENLGEAEGSSLGESYSATVVDYNLDGCLDIFLSNDLGDSDEFLEEGYELLQNEGNDNHWISLDLEGVESNRDGIGAKVYVTAGGITQLREQDGGIHHRAQDHKRLHIGLAQNESIDEILVQWGSGRESRITNIAADRLIKITEPSSEPIIEPLIDTSLLYVPEQPILPVEISATSNSGFTNVGGFYQAINTEGTVIDPLSGREITVEDEGYEAAALANSIVELSDGENITLELENDFIYVPYLLANGKRFFTAYEEVNADGLKHVQLRSEDAFGFEDLLGGGDNDFNDYVIEIVRTEQSN